MARLSMNETTTFRWSFEEDVAQYAAAGIPGIGVWRHKLSDFGVEKGIELLREHQLDVSHLLWAGGFTGNDGRSYRESVEDGLEAVRTAAALGSDCLVVHSGGRAGHTFNHARRLFKLALGELEPAAAEAGVFLAIEPMHPGCASEWTFINSLDDAARLLDEVGSDRVKLVFDTYHLGQEPDAPERAEEIAPRIAIVQLGDARKPPEGEQDRCPLGQGNIPIEEIVGALRAGGYEGFFDVELLGEEMESWDYQELLAHAKAAFVRLRLGGAE